MLTLELVSKKRNPIKKYAFYGILAGIAILILVALFNRLIINPVKMVIMLAVALDFIIGLFIINYSYKFKKGIGYITFSNDYIEIDVYEKKEVIQIDSLTKVRFKLTGYEGANTSTIFENIMWFPSYFSYHSGINNFVYLYSSRGHRSFEFFIPNKQSWIAVKAIANMYRERLG
jgi:hypothetical protein